jgi:2-polyprenyl-3-methyl-5-hydroxy-6-metoxy-1,4-benzoquinol methylase
MQLPWDLDHEMFFCVECETVQRKVTDEGEYMNLYESGDYYALMQSKREGYSEEERFEHDLEVDEVRVLNIKTACVDMNTSVFGILPREAVVLDVGCGNGALCRSLLDAGFGTVYGIDPDPHAIKFAENKVPEAAFSVGTMRHCSINTEVDVVTFIDSLEHDLDPIECLCKAGSVLSRGGRVVIETPDCGSSGFKKMGAKWKHVKPAEHPFLFSLKSIEAMICQAGLVLCDVRYTIPGRIMVTGERL